MVLGAYVLSFFNFRRDLTDCRGLSTICQVWDYFEVETAGEAANGVPESMTRFGRKGNAENDAWVIQEFEQTTMFHIGTAVECR